MAKKITALMFSGLMVFAAFSGLAANADTLDSAKPAVNLQALGVAAAPPNQCFRVSSYAEVPPLWITQRFNGLVYACPKCVKAGNMWACPTSVDKVLE